MRRKNADIVRDVLNRRAAEREAHEATFYDSEHETDGYDRSGVVDASGGAHSDTDPGL